MEQAEAYFLGDKLLVTATFIAKMLGLSRRTVVNYDMPKVSQRIGKKHLYDWVEAMAWHKENIDQNMSKKSKGSKAVVHDEDELNPNVHLPDEDAPKEELERRNEYEKLLKMRMNNAILDGTMVLADEQDKSLATLAAIFRASFTNYEKSAPSLTENKPSSEILSILQDAHDNMVDKLDALINKEYGDKQIDDIIYAVVNKLVDGESAEDILNRVNR